MKYVLAFFVTSLYATPLNFPHQPELFDSNTVFLASSGSPKTLDPAKSYTSEGANYISQIVEPPLTYSYFARPYALVPLAAKYMPKVSFYDRNGNSLNSDKQAQLIAETHYDIYLRDDLIFGPHPAYGNTRRAAKAKDFVYAIKRLASPKVNSPIFSIMAAHIKGFSEFNSLLMSDLKKHPELNHEKVFWDLRNYEMSGLKVITPDHYQIITKGFYRPFIYWLAMNFFAPMPYEVDRYYSQTGLAPGFGHDWYPVGTGPYLIEENDPNSKIVLIKNKNYHDDFFPLSTNPNDIVSGYTELSGKRLPFVDKFVYSVEKESISSWNKFIHGYYDSSGVGSDNFDQIMALSQQGELGLSAEMKAKGINLAMTTSPSVFFMGFNMLDPVVGGSSESARLLRMAISIAVDQEEFISIFLNGRGIAAHGPIPPGILGGDSAFNKYVYNHAGRKTIAEARELMSAAGYPDGIDPKTNKHLSLRLDTVSSAGAASKAELAWYISQFKKLGIDLNIASTQYNRFQDKIRNGQAQIFRWGWIADYPDPENFLFLLYGPNGKVAHNGENAVNYNNPKYNLCFESMRDMQNSPERLKIIQQCVAILQHDAPWVFGFYSQSFGLTHAWLNKRKLNPILNNNLKYIKLDYSLRKKHQTAWNSARFDYLYLFMGVLFLLPAIAVCAYMHKKSRSPLKNE